MANNNSTIIVNRGDDTGLTLTFKDENGVAVDLTGSTLFFTVKNGDYADEADDTDAEIAKEVTTHDDPTNGITSVSLTNSDTDLEAGDYVYDFQLKDSSNKIMSTQAGIFRVRADVTKRTS